MSSSSYWGKAAPKQQSRSPSQTSGSDDPVFVSPESSVASGMPKKPETTLFGDSNTPQRSTQQEHQATSASDESSTSSGMPQKPEAARLGGTVKPNSEPNAAKKQQFKRLEQISGDEEGEQTGNSRFKKQVVEEEEQPAALPRGQKPPRANQRKYLPPRNTDGEELRQLRVRNQELENDLRMKEQQLKNQQEEFEEEKAAEHEDLLNQVDDLTEQLDKITMERNDLVAENNDIKERNETLDAEYKQMELDLAAKDEEIKRIRAQVREGPVKRADHIKLKNNYNALIDELEKQEARIRSEMVSKADFAAMEQSKENYKNKLIEKNEEVDQYHKEMKAHVSGIMTSKENQQKTYQECLKTMEQNEQKWRRALENSENRHRYFISRSNEAEYELNRVKTELHWKNQDLQSLNGRIHEQDREISRLSRAEEDLHRNIKELMTKHEDIVHQKMQAEQHLQDHAQRNEADQKRLQELKRQQDEMARQLQVGQDERNRLMTSRKNFEKRVKDNENQFKNKLKEQEEKLETFEELEEGTV
ncbi:Oidioi.mRNA.OKI2018_I69.PAR.g10021.t1.cds [Oikopleura dioica]|uniref:Oidioi.mRNA.OKI2018_I69.PAR.g10021.t1.cds n=1 Tax=Oikopleura dioica TaxID=34765 RepID=A0ABN7RPI6_OIKDI|nr:Oidioi.mRNA.OKI2018_I69.PAR.g10021.t1.cds [Oikopleura dioica]